MAQKSRKKILNTPDEFMTTTGSLLKWIKENPGRFTAGAVIVVAIVASVAGFFYWQSTREHDAMIAYHRAASDQATTETVAQQYATTRAGKLAKLRLATLAYQDGKAEEAVTLADDFINSWGREDAFYWQALFLLGTAHLNLGNNEQALPPLETCAQKAPEDIRQQALLHKGFALQRLGRVDEARQTLLMVSGSSRDLALASLNNLHTATAEDQPNAE